jgi:D-alanyl-D-alanine carboxypeptidase/D-alanyl-D-alanine-endopeptidase (penicillin-binding protein 4)
MKRLLFFFLAILPVSLLGAQDFNTSPKYSDELTDSLIDELAVADSLPWPLNVQTRVAEMLMDPMFETSQVGLMVYDLTDDMMLTGHQERLLLRPASTMKLLTAITAIDLLGGSYQFRTSLYYKGTISNHTLRGDLYCVGGMDPAFDGDDMQAFVESLRRLGVDTLRGRIVADVSMKDTLRYGKGWCWDDDNPVLSPLLISKDDHFTARFIDELTDDGIVIDTISLARGTLPADAEWVCSRSHTIDQILTRMMKESDNLYAESMFYQIAAYSGRRPARDTDAKIYMRQLIRRLGLDPEGYRLADGSGLSLYNYLSAELETLLLRYAWQHHHIRHYLLPSLPIAGEDGTLKKRMHSRYTSGNVRAKTGTLTGITSLAGYCTAANGHELCFAIINQGELSNSKARRFQDRLCNALCQP